MLQEPSYLRPKSSGTAVSMFKNRQPWRNMMRQEHVDAMLTDKGRANKPYQMDFSCPLVFSSPSYEQGPSGVGDFKRKETTWSSNLYSLLWWSGIPVCMTHLREEEIWFLWSTLGAARNRDRRQGDRRGSERHLTPEAAFEPFQFPLLQRYCTLVYLFLAPIKGYFPY